MNEKQIKIEELKTELQQLQESEDVTGADRLARTEELVAEIKQLQAEVAAAAAAEALLSDESGDSEESADEAGESADDAGSDESSDESADEAGDSEEKDSSTEGDTDEAGNDAESDEVADTEGDTDVTITPEQEAAALAASQTKDKPVVGNKPNRIVAAITTDGFSAGSVMGAEDIARAQRIAKGRNEGIQIVAQISNFQGEHVEALHGRRSPDENARMLAEAQYREYSSLTAACFCDPAEAIKDISTRGQSARPVLDSFRTVPVTGNFKYTKDLGLADVDGAAVIWECADQEGVDPLDPETHKPCVELDCGVEVEVNPYAIPVCGTYSTFTELSHPQRVQAFMDKLDVLYARTAERQLLDAIYAASRVWSHSTPLGLYATLIGILGNLPSPLTYGERTGSFEGYTAYLPIGTLQALITDILLSGTRNVDASSAEKYVRDTLAALGISRIIEIHDVDTANETANYLPPVAALPPVGISDPWVPGTNNVATHKIYILKQEDFRVGQSTIVEAGTIRDASLVKQNKVQWFFEGLEFLEKTGLGESVVLELEACTSGLGSGNDVSGLPCEPAEVEG